MAEICAQTCNSDQRQECISRIADNNELEAEHRTALNEACENDWVDNVVWHRHQVDQRSKQAKRLELVLEDCPGLINGICQITPEQIEATRNGWESYRGK